jgi:hypothetical protein
MNNKSIRLFLRLSTRALLLLPGLTFAQPTAHYAPGSEGLKCATLPPPGLYARDYTCFYVADRVNGPAGQSVGPANFDVFTFANVPRLVYISDVKVLGGYLGVNALLPLVSEHVKAGPFDSSTFGAADLFVDTMLSWHLKRFDFVFGCGVWMPTGDSDAPPTTRAGLGYWATMLTAGGTWYFDTDKTWAISLLSRYEINDEQRDTHITPGQAFTLEWGLSKTFNRTIDVGPVGYYQQKVTTDSGLGATDNRDRVAAVGPEVSAVIPMVNVHASLRYVYEFMAEDRAQGHSVTLTLTKRF